MQQKTALITGAKRGLGLEAARLLETNVTGAVALTLALSGHLLNALEPSVVMVSSSLGSFGKCAGEGAPWRKFMVAAIRRRSSSRTSSPHGPR